MMFKLFNFLGTVKDLSGTSGSAPSVIGLLIGVLAAGYVFVAYLLTAGIMQSIIPTIRAETEAATLMSGALGGRVVTASGTRETLAIDPQGAQLRTREELTISIPTGFFSSGRAFKYFRPVLSVKGKDGKWPYAFDIDAKKPEFEPEIRKAHPDLKWIVSMPIPYQVQPFKLTCGVLNVDGLEGDLTPDQLRVLLTDMSTAAALIAVLNRSTGFLEGQYSRPSEPSDTEQEQLRGYLIPSEDFDPASCPEPSQEFVQALSNVRGLEFFRRVSQTEVASFLRGQLRS
ncbi:MAG: hypothetical protein HYZ65_11895 [Burkholderiales bacterium]|nr:hypothetical protein [Burkholderiales bacterium]